MKRLDALVIAGLTVLAGALGTVTIQAQERRARRYSCQDRLVKLALAAIQYADERRSFPHVTGGTELDGGVETNHSPRLTRAMIFLGYGDDPTLFVCPDSSDRAAPVSEAATRDLRRWFWGGGRAPAPDVSPLADADSDPTLQATTELSYGWTRRSAPASAIDARSPAPLLADRSAEHHQGRVNVVSMDGSARTEPFSPRLTGTGGEDGCLAIEERRSKDPRRF